MSKASDAVPLGHLLQTQGTSLPPVFLRARRLAEVTRVLRTALPGQLAEHCLGVNIVRNTLVLFADSAPWATRLRYEQKAILAAISRETGLSFARISLRVQPRSRRKAPKSASRRGHRISPASREVLEAAARGISDPDLAAALRRLARNSGNGSP
jgi:hypothetical protein